MNRRDFTGTAGGALAALVLPNIGPRAGQGRVATFYLDSDCQWGGLNLPGVKLEGEGMLIVRIALDPGGQSTLQVGLHGEDWGHVYGQEIPLTPEMLANILECCSKEYGLYFITSEDAKTWLDPWGGDDGPPAGWTPPPPPVIPKRGVYYSEQQGDGPRRYGLWTSGGTCLEGWSAPAGCDEKAFTKLLWNELDKLDPLPTS